MAFINSTALEKPVKVPKFGKDNIIVRREGNTWYFWQKFDDEGVGMRVFKEERGKCEMVDDDAMHIIGGSYIVSRLYDLEPLGELVITNGEFDFKVTKLDCHHYWLEINEE